jgi:hypothetical protein
MASTALKVAAFVIIVAMIGSIGVYATIGLRGRQQATTTESSTPTQTTSASAPPGALVYRTSLKNGTVLHYLWKISYINNTLKKPKVTNMTVILRVTGTKGPWVEANMSVSNESQSVSYPYGSVLLPLNYLGKDMVEVPLYTGLGRACVSLSLVGLKSVDGKEAYEYKGEVDQLGYSIKLRLYYDKETGIMLLMVSNITVFPFANTYVKGNLTLKLTSVDEGKGESLEIMIPKSFICGNGFSSDLRLTATGLYEISGGLVRNVSDVESTTPWATSHLLRWSTRSVHTVRGSGQYCSRRQTTPRLTFTLLW